MSLQGRRFVLSVLKLLFCVISAQGCCFVLSHLKAAVWSVLKLLFCFVNPQGCCQPSNYCFVLSVLKAVVSPQTVVLSALKLLFCVVSPQGCCQSSNCCFVSPQTIVLLCQSSRLLFCFVSVLFCQPSNCFVLSALKLFCFVSPQGYRFVLSVLKAVVLCCQSSRLLFVQSSNCCFVSPQTVVLCCQSSRLLFCVVSPQGCCFVLSDIKAVVLYWHNNTCMQLPSQQ